MSRRRRGALAVAALAAAMLCVHQANADPKAYLRPASVPSPAGNKPTAARIALGKALFFDPRLSGSGVLSCASCHNPGLGWSDALPTALGAGLRVLPRATPTLVNVGYGTIFMWDGRAATLEEQALGPITTEFEMNQKLPALLRKLEAIAGYRKLFEGAYPGEGITEATIGKALASFERTIVSTESPFDRWVMGEDKAVGPGVKRGFGLFESKGRCAACHRGFNFTDNGFHNIGVKDLGEKPDLGRFVQRAVPMMRGAFKTPTLRDVALTAPYMHNGIYSTLEEVVEHYDRGGEVKDNLSPEIRPLGLTAQEKADLVAFMKALTGKPVEVTIPRLPN